MKKWYLHKLKLIAENPYSVSGKRIHNPSGKNVAHVLPKRKTGGFPCIAEHPINWLPLTWQEHSELDRAIDTHTLDKFKLKHPKIYKEWARKAKLLLPLVKPNKLYWYLKEELDI